MIIVVYGALQAANSSQQSDVTDSGHFQSTIKKILAEHSAIDTVIMMSGVQNVPLFKDPNSINAQKISTEISTNLIAPCVLAQVLVPHFVSKKTPTNIVLVSSGLAYVPVPLYAVYNATKAGVHYFALGLRGQLADTSVNVVELAPPYVDTELDASHREMVGKMMGPGAPDPMPLNEYLDDAIGKLDQRVDGKPLKEVAVGFSENGVGAWRKAFDPILESMSLGAM